MVFSKIIKEKMSFREIKESFQAITFLDVTRR